MQISSFKGSEVILGKERPVAYWESNPPNGLGTVSIDGLSITEAMQLLTTLTTIRAHVSSEPVSAPPTVNEVDQMAGVPPDTAPQQIQEPSPEARPVIDRLPPELIPATPPVPTYMMRDIEPMMLPPQMPAQLQQAAPGAPVGDEFLRICDKASGVFRYLAEKPECSSADKLVQFCIKHQNQIPALEKIPQAKLEERCRKAAAVLFSPSAAV